MTAQTFKAFGSYWFVGSGTVGAVFGPCHSPCTRPAAPKLPPLDHQAIIANFDSRPFSGYLEELHQLRREGPSDVYEALLMRCVQATERQSQLDGQGVAPGYYERLAILYRKLDRHADEIAILERYEAQQKAPGAIPAQLAARLAKLRPSGSKDEPRAKLARQQETGGTALFVDGRKAVPTPDLPLLAKEPELKIDSTRLVWLIVAAISAVASLVAWILQK